MKLFRGFRNAISNVAQIVLVVILLPFIAIIIGLISGTGSGAGNMSGMISSLIGKIPLCDMWVDILHQYTGGLTASDVASSTMLVIVKAFPEALISAICVYFCVQIGKKIGARGLPIFTTFAGIVIATIITSLTGLGSNLTTEILIDFGVVIIMIIGMKIMFSGTFGGTRIMTGKKVLLLIIDGLLAVITTAYVSVLLLAASGVYANIGQAIGRIYLLTGIEIIAVLIVWGVNEAVDPDEVL